MKKFIAKRKNEKGITLVALVVTIVILIILATISVSAVLGEGGLIKQAKDAAKDFKDSIAKEEGDMNILAQEYANIIAGGGEVKPPKPDPTEKWDLNKVNKVESEDKKIVPVPKGYVASTVAGEKSVDTGFVIKEGNNGAATEGINEFVWVPVENISDLYDSANNAGQLWDFGTKSAGWKNPAVKRAYPTTQNSGNREPDVVTNALDAISANLEQAGLPAGSTAKDFKIQLQNEFKEMRESVETYGGFYIGRYETGNLSQAKAVVQKGNTDIGSQTWYTHYKLNKEIVVNNNVKSSMIWGNQWDATLRWMQSSSNPEVSNFPTNSDGKGSESSGIPTGSVPEYGVNNIYDMAGNVADWTIEACNNNCRVMRGGISQRRPSGGGGGGGSAISNPYPACIRYIDEPLIISDRVGSRSTLYITLNA